MKFKLLAAIFSTLFVFNVTPAFAEHETSAEHKTKSDTNNDGKISYDEYRAAKEQRTERQFKRMDVNGDGFIDASEQKVAKDKMRALREKRKQKLQETTEDPT